MVRVEQSATFLKDAVTQIGILADAEEWSRIERLREDIAELQARLGMFPEIGREIAHEEKLTLRRVGVGRLPYLVWYFFDPRGNGFVQLHRIFHARQRTPRPKLPESG